MLVALALLSCAEDSREPDDTSAVSDNTGTSESSSSGTDNSDIIEDPSETVEVYITSSRSLTAATESYDTSYLSGGLYWTYTAVKQDGYFTTGQVTEEAPLKTYDGEPTKGLPDGSIGTFSVGKWLFSFYAYTPLTDDDGNESEPWEYDEDTGTYSFASDCLYYTAMDDSGTVSLSSSNSTIDVNVQPVEAIGDYGELTITVEGFKNSDGTDADITSAYTLMYTLSDGTDTLYDDELTLGETTTLENLDVGSYTLTVYLLTESGTLASQELSVQIRANLTTAVTGALEESEDGTVSVYLGSYILSTDGGETYYQYTYNEETGEYDSSLVYVVSAYCANEAYSTVYVTVDEDGNATFDLSSITNGDMTLTSVTDVNGDELYDSGSTTITLTGNTSLYYVWTTDYTVSLSLASLSYTGSTDTDSATYTVTLTPSGSDDDSSAISASSGEETINGEIISVDITLSGVQTGVYTLTLTALDGDGDYITLHNEEDSSTSYTQTVVINTASLDVELSFYPSMYFEFVLDDETAASSMNLFTYVDGEELLSDSDTSGGWNLSDFSVYTSSDKGTNWTKTDNAANSITADASAYVKIKLMDNGVFPIFHLVWFKSGSSYGACPVKEIVTMPTLGIDSTEAITNLSAAGGIYNTYYAYNASPFAGIGMIINNTYLETLPEGLFKNNPQLVDMTCAFQYCTALGSLPSDLFCYTPDVESFNSAFYNCKGLTTVPEGLFADNTEATDFSMVFSYCTSLESIPSGLFDACVEAEDFSFAFSGTSALASLPAGLFDKNTKVTTFAYGFYSSGLTEIPAGLFDNCSNVTTFTYAFWYCDSLEAIPSGLFSKNTEVTTFKAVFSYCTSLTEIPSGLFDSCTAATDFSDAFSNCTRIETLSADIFAKCTKAETFSYTFNKCTSLTEIPSGLFDKVTSATNFTFTFGYCSSLTSIPDGLFDNVKATSFNGTFGYCTNLTTIPSGLFKGQSSATNFTSVFSSCALTTIPDELFEGVSGALKFDSAFYGNQLESIPEGLFDDCTAATSFYRTFESNTSLQEIPENLFYYNTAVTTFQMSFALCSSLTEIPEGLFSKNTAVTSFASTFSGCTVLEEIPEELFSENTAVTSFASTFSGCTGLTSIPSGLFATNTLVTSFASTFYNCTDLTSVPENLFDNNTAVTSFEQLFYNCTSLASVDSKLFVYNTKVTNFKSTFRGCSSLSLTLYIGTESLSSKSNAQYFAYGNADKATVYTKSSTIAGYFNNASNSNVTATADTPEGFSWPE